MRGFNCKGIQRIWATEVPRHFLTVLGGQTLPAAEKGSGRLELAQWITDPANPLTARVMANRIWQFHFGAGIVKSPNDFGCTRPAADQSATARLSGHALHAERLVDQVDAQADHAVAHLSDGQQR